MEQDVFKAGVNPGGLNTQTEIKMLLCFILSKIKTPMSFMQLYDALSENNLVNYFELVGALELLESSEHLYREESSSGEDTYTITSLGQQAAQEFTNTLPLSVREKALQSVNKLLERQKRQTELEIFSTPAPGGGFMMHLAIPEEGGELLSFSLFVPTEEECVLIRRRFLNAPQFIYKAVLALLTGDQEVLDEAFPGPEERLF